MSEPPKKAGGRKRAVANGSESPSPKRATGKRKLPNLNVSESAALQAAIGPIVARDPKNKEPTKDELEGLGQAVIKGDIGDELKRIIDVYDVGKIYHKPSAREETLARLADLYESHEEHFRWLKDLSDPKEDREEEDISEGASGKRINQEIATRSVDVHHGVEYLRQLEEELSSNTADTKKKQLVERIRRLVEGSLAELSESEVNSALPDILRQIKERDPKKKTPLQKEVGLMLKHIVEGERWGNELLKIAEHLAAKSAPAGKLNPYAWVSNWMKKATQLMEETDLLEFMIKEDEMFFHDGNRDIADSLRRYVAPRIRELQSYIRKKDKEDAVISGKLEELALLSPQTDADTARQGYAEIEAIKIFLDPDPQTEEGRALNKIAQKKRRVKVLRRVVKVLQGELMADWYQEDAMEEVKIHNSLCREFSDQYPEKANEYRYFLEELDSSND